MLNLKKKIFLVWYLFYILNIILCDIKVIDVCEEDVKDIRHNVVDPKLLKEKKMEKILIRN